MEFSKLKNDVNDSSKPIFIQVAQMIEESIFTGAYIEKRQIPFTNEIALVYKINPATVLKEMTILYTL